MDTSYVKEVRHLRKSSDYKMQNFLAVLRLKVVYKKNQISYAWYSVTFFNDINSIGLPIYIYPWF